MTIADPLPDEWRQIKLAGSLALGFRFGLASALFASTGLIFCGWAAYLNLLPLMEPRWAALVVGAGSLTIAVIAALIAEAIVSRSSQRLATVAKSSAIVTLAPQVLRFVARHARLVGVASAVGAAIYSIQNRRSV
jgi:hypothetical protein